MLRLNPGQSSYPLSWLLFSPHSPSFCLAYLFCSFVVFCLFVLTGDGSQSPSNWTVFPVPYVFWDRALSLQYTAMNISCNVPGYLHPKPKGHRAALQGPFAKWELCLTVTTPYDSVLTSLGSREDQKDDSAAFKPLIDQKTVTITNWQPSLSSNPWGVCIPRHPLDTWSHQQQSWILSHIIGFFFSKLCVQKYHPVSEQVLVMCPEQFEVDSQN